MTATTAIRPCILLTCALSWGCAGPSSTASDTTSTESGLSSSETGSESGTGESGTDETGGEETGGEEDLCGGWSMTARLTGAAQPPEACANYIFTGTLMVSHEGSIFELDSCPCDADCDNVDPYELRLIRLGGTVIPPYLSLPECPQIEVYRDNDCNVVGLVVRNLMTPSVPLWWMASRDAVLPGFEWLSNQIEGEQVCSEDGEGPTLVGHSIAFSAGGEQLMLLPGEYGVLAGTPLGDLHIDFGNAASVIGDPGVVMSDLSYVVTPL